jgi:hypothetical protein
LLNYFTRPQIFSRPGARLRSLHPHLQYAVILAQPESSYFVVACYLPVELLPLPADIPPHPAFYTVF